MSQIGLIPHAGKPYSGICRKQTFQKMKKKPSEIIYLANDHHNRVSGSIVAINFKSEHSWIDSISIKDDSNEHSYMWVIPEIESYFKLDRSQIKSYLIGQNWLSQKNKILKLLSDTYQKGGNIIVTADLIHYGESYNFQDLQEPVIYHKFQMPRIKAI